MICRVRNRVSNQSRIAGQLIQVHDKSSSDIIDYGVRWLRSDYSMSKLSGKAKTSQLSTIINATKKEPKQSKGKLVKQNKYKDYPRSYRLDQEIMNVLKDTLERINDASPKKVSEARLVKALIFLSKNIEEEKILKALKEVW